MITGIVASAVNIAAAPSGLTARYFKFMFNNYGGDRTYLPEFKITSTSGNLPPDMTNNNNAPFIISGNAWTPSGVYLCTNGALNSTPTFDPTGAYIIIDMGSDYTVTGWTVNSGSWNGSRLPGSMWLYSSNTGSFAGEEILIGSAFGQTFPANNTFKSYNVF